MAWCNNAALSSQIGLLGLPFQFFAGILHEVDPGSLGSEVRAQGITNAFLDATGDITANTLGMLGGLLVPPTVAPYVGRYLGSLIPGPGDPDRHGRGVGGYNGRPLDAWENRSQ